MSKSTPSLATMAVLTELTIHVVGMKGKDDYATTAANTHLNTTNAAGYYSKCIVARADIIDAIRIRDKARQFRKSLTRPYGEKDLRILPTERLLEYDAGISDYKHDFELAVLDIVANWPAIVDKQKSRLNQTSGNLFDPNDYPTQAEVQNEFAFYEGQMPVPDASHFMLDIEKQVVDKLKRNLERDNKKKMEQSFADLLKRLHAPVSNMADICANDKRVFDSLVTNLDEQIGILADLNLTGDKQFAAMIDEVKDRLTGFTPGQIRVDKKLKQQLGNEANDVANKLESMLGKLPS